MSGVFHRNRAENRRQNIDQEAAYQRQVDEDKRLADIEQQNAEARAASGERQRGGAAANILAGASEDPNGLKSARKTLLGI
jgi:hypothetical protein